MSIISLVIVGLIGVVGEIVDSSLGMMYGTLLSPILVLLGYSPKLVVPSILLSQAIGGGVAAFRHNRFRNANFRGLTRDLKISLAIIIPGLLACILGAFVGQKISAVALRYYIGILVILMGLLCVRPIHYKFSWRRIWGIGALAGFNKALSGGGFGPVTATGKIVSGVDPKVSVGTTTLAEVPICLLSFTLWIILGGSIAWEFPLVLCIVAAIGGFIGPIITLKINTKVLRMVVGMLALVSGILVVAGFKA